MGTSKTGRTAGCITTRTELTRHPFRSLLDCEFHKRDERDILVE